MSEDKPKTHRIFVTLSTESLWTTEEVAEMVEELLLMESEVDEPAFTEISAFADPNNADSGLEDAVEGTLSLLDFYAEFLRKKVEEKGWPLTVLDEGLKRVEHGVIDLKACLRCLSTLASSVAPDVLIDNLDPENLENFSKEVLHILAHKMGLEHPDCASMDKEDLIDWIRNKMGTASSAPPLHTVN